MAVTRDDVARRAGVSPAVVSYVLNGGPRPVSPGLRQRVHAAIEELGYRRDGVARYLRTGKTHSLALVVPDISLPYFGVITQVLCELSIAHGYQMLTASTSWDPMQERAQLVGLAERRVDGIILMSVDPLQSFDEVSNLGIPVVLIDRPEVAVLGAQTATQHLLEHGRREIAYVGGPSGYVSSDRRVQGWRAALEQSDIEPREAMLGREPFAPPGMPGYALARTLLSRMDRPNGVVVESDPQAMGVLHACRDLSIRVPEDLAVVTLGGTRLAEFALPTLTSVEQPMEAIAGEALAAVLSAEAGAIRRLDNQNFAIVLRESCGPH